MFNINIKATYSRTMKRKPKVINRIMKHCLLNQSRINRAGYDYGYQEFSSSYKDSYNGDEYSDPQNSVNYNGYQKKTQQSADIVNWNCVDIEDPENIRQEYCGQYEDDRENLYQIEEENSIDVASELLSKNNDGDFAIIPTTDKVVFQGFLKKFNSKTSKYIKRWCILTENTFGYFKYKNDTTPLFAIELKSISRITKRNHTHLGAAKYKFEIIPLYSDFTNESDQGCRDQYLNLYEELDLNNDALETYSFFKGCDYEYEDIHKIQSQSLKNKAIEITDQMNRISHLNRKDEHSIYYGNNFNHNKEHSPSRNYGSRQRSFSEDKEADINLQNSIEEESHQLQLKKALKSITIAPTKFKKLIERTKSFSDALDSRFVNNEEKIESKQTYIFGCDDKNIFDCWVSLINAGTL